MIDQPTSAIPRRSLTFLKMCFPPCHTNNGNFVDRLAYGEDKRESVRHFDHAAVADSMGLIPIPFSIVPKSLQVWTDRIGTCIKLQQLQKVFSIHRKLPVHLGVFKNNSFIHTGYWITGLNKSAEQKTGLRVVL